MTPAQKDKTIREITLEIIRAKVSFTVEALPGHPITINILKRLLITERLREEVFMANLDEMDTAILLVRFAAMMTFERNFPQASSGTSLQTVQN